MTDAHCHLSSGNGAIREFMIGRDFVGIHPWDAEAADLSAGLDACRAALDSGLARGIGEIGLDRLKSRTISEKMRTVFEAQLALASTRGCPAVLHGAKCWGQVIEAITRLPKRPSGFLCHGFSRALGLVPEIIRLGGFISVGPAVLNDHAVNYHALVKAIPDCALLVETDRTWENATSCPPLADIVSRIASLRNTTPEALEALTDENAERFFSSRN